MVGARMRKILFIGLCLSFLSGCNSELKTKEKNILEVTKDVEVHYEGTNEDGVFVEHEVIKDPVSDEYEEGIATPLQAVSKKTIINNGSSLNRVDIVFVGDGYTSEELSKYEVDAQNISDKFLEEAPLKNYKSYFNVHRVDVVSKDSGVTNDISNNVKRNTAMGMNYWCSNIERMLCVNVQKAKQFAANISQVDQILAIANSSKHGGAGYWNDGVGTLSARNPSSIETAIHEFGHIFGKLGDEYEYAGSSTSSCAGKENGSFLDAKQMLEQKSKWFRWLDLSHINTFKGSCYSNSVYRPTINSKMRTLGMPFYEVNSEQLIFSIYSKVKPIDSATPKGTYPRNYIFRVVPMKPVSHDLDIRWYHNGKEIEAMAQKTSFSVASIKITGRSNSISVKVTDLTDLVRDESKRQKLMSETRTWTIR